MEETIDDQLMFSAIHVKSTIELHLISRKEGGCSVEVRKKTSGGVTGRICRVLSTGKEGGHAGCTKNKMES